MAASKKYPAWLHTRWHVAVLFAVSFIASIPVLFTHIGGDIFSQLSLIECYAEPFWRGTFRFDWCPSTNGGLGGPATLLYFKGAFTLPTLLYPLTWIGLDTYGIYAISSFLGTVLMALASYSWLKDHVTPERALLAAVIMLVMPYRMEMMYFRSAYAEPWCLALMPLIFKYTRRIVRGENKLPHFALSFAAIGFIHPGIALIAAFFSGLYVVLMSWHNWRTVARFALAGLWGAAMMVFSVTPSLYYKAFLNGHALWTGKRSWAADFLLEDNLYRQTPVVLNILLTVIVISMISLRAIRLRPLIGEAFMRREAYVWGVLFVTSLFLLLPVSAPLYALTGETLRNFIFPWRMQNMFVLAAGFYSAIYMQWLMTEKQRRTAQGDYTLLLAMLFMCAVSVSAKVDPEELDEVREEAQLHYAWGMQFQTVWTDWEYASPEAIAKHERGIAAGAPRLHVVKGKGKTTLENWGWDGITVQTQSAKPMRVKLEHFYFPTWRARDENGQAVPLSPETPSGRMLLDVPAGKHRITLSTAVTEPQPWLMISRLIAALAWLGVALAIAGHRRRNLLQ